MQIKGEEFIYYDPGQAINAAMGLAVSNFRHLYPQLDAPLVASIVQEDRVKDQECTLCPVIHIPCAITGLTCW
jgi:hypothetical protein